MILVVRNENGTGSSSAACMSRLAQSMRAADEARWRPGLEPPHLEAEAVKPLRELLAPAHRPPGRPGSWSRP